MRVILIGAALIVATCTACSHARQDISGPPVALPQVYDAPASGEASVDPRWWASFGDEALDSLVERAMEDNLDLRQSWARIEQFSALARQQGSAALPQVNADFSAARRRSVGFDGKSLHSNQFALNGAASYEVDIWGRVGALSEASALDAAASREDLDAIAMTIAAQVAEAWFGLVEQRAQLDLLASQNKTNEQFLELVELRFSQGLTSALDVFQQRQQLLSTQSQVPLTQARLAATQHQLAALLGVPAGHLETPDTRTLARLPPLPATGLPSELLRRRPDLRSAQTRLAAADKRVEAAIAEKFPALRLTGSAGLQADDLGDLLDNFVWSLASSVAMPIFDGGRRSAEVDRQKAALDERLAAYSKAILQAFKEVQDAIVSERSQRTFLEMNEAQLELGHSTLREARARYVQGLGDFLPVLTALQRVQQLEQGHLSAQRQLISTRIQLHRALGGDWTISANPAKRDVTP